MLHRTNIRAGFYCLSLTFLNVAIVVPKFISEMKNPKGKKMKNNCIRTCLV